MTDGGLGGTIESADGTVRFASSRAPDLIAGTYGAGDSFAAALTWYLARQLPIVQACERAAAHGAAVLSGVNPIDAQLPLV
jgi:ribokinase